MLKEILRYIKRLLLGLFWDSKEDTLRSSWYMGKHNIFKNSVFDNAMR